MAKSKTTTSPKTKRPAKKAGPKPKAEPKHPDAALIILCITIGAELGAYNASWGIDTDGSNVHTVAVCEPHLEAAYAAVKKVSGMKAKTIDGLLAKACVLPKILDDDMPSLQERSGAFLRTFAEDVRTFAKAELTLKRMQEAGEKQTAQVSP